MTTLYKTILILSNVPLFAAVAYGAFAYKSFGLELKSFSYFLFLSGAIELVSGLLWFNGSNNLPLLHLYVAGGFFFLCLFYEKVLDGFVDKRITRGILVVFLTLTFINSAFIQTIFTFNSYALTMESILLVILSLSTYMLMMNDLVKKKRLKLAKSLNWINSGLFIYYSSNLILFYFGDFIMDSFSTEINLQTWMLHAFFSMIMYFCFFVGIWHRPQP